MPWLLGASQPAATTSPAPYAGSASTCSDVGYGSALQVPGKTAAPDQPTGDYVFTTGQGDFTFTVYGPTNNYLTYDTPGGVVIDGAVVVGGSSYNVYFAGEDTDLQAPAESGTPPAIDNFFLCYHEGAADTPGPGASAGPSASPSDTPSPTHSPTPSRTPSARPTATPMPTPSVTPTATPSVVPTATTTATPTAPSTPTPTGTPTATPSVTSTPSVLPSSSQSPTPTPTGTSSVLPTHIIHPSDTAFPRVLPRTGSDTGGPLVLSALLLLVGGMLVLAPGRALGLFRRRLGRH